ncbi:hypothetical protein [Sorangium sp. So ce887]|uniref:hypothetical protein n=1 Tax=Sorangium sp. So ce887 TaxID=3133324 RepID=UPI003F60BC91
MKHVFMLFVLLGMMAGCAVQADGSTVEEDGDSVTAGEAADAEVGEAREAASSDNCTCDADICVCMCGAGGDCEREGNVWYCGC